MIRVKLSGDRLVPVVVCAKCGNEIENLGLGAVVIGFVDGGDIARVYPVCKGSCHDQFEALVKERYGETPGWIELRDFLSRFDLQKD